ncbi:MAG: DNA recombination protein RmuC [Clostridia bacterium]|nr:DNA recombination protein RmuC [Clostridia bacterium]
MCFLFGRKKLLAKQEELLRRTEELEKELAFTRESIGQLISTTVVTSNNTLLDGVKNTLQAVTENVNNTLKNNEVRIAEVKSDLNRNLAEIRADNEKRLTEMRQVVEEKLTSTINERLSQTFVTINERLDAVNKGLGEMQSLTTGVTDLKKILGNVRTRGTFGEISLSNLLSNILTTEQYKEQYKLKTRANDLHDRKVDFVILLPGENKDEKVLLPIDAKFPMEDYQRLVAASEAGDQIATQESVKALENAVKQQAKSIKEKYIVPPQTVDFAIMYLPIEGLYAEVARNAGLLEELRAKYKVIPAGPTTIAALLNSLQIGFKTLAVQKSSKEIYELLVKFKGDFVTFIGNIEKAQTQVGQIGKTLEDATKRTAMMMKKIEKVEGLAPPVPSIED